MATELTPFEILLVEDNPSDVEITVRALKKGQVTNPLRVARDGQEALDILFGRNNGDAPLPGLILLDLNLPRVDGREVLAKIKAHPKLKRIPVIVLTTSTLEQDVAHTYDLGANTYITKPVQFEEFISVVSTIRDYWISIATVPRVRRDQGDFCDD